MPKVSVCCSVLNQSEWLKDMISSVVAQTFKDWELIVVDDGSTENIREVVESFKDSRIRFHRFDKNRGIPHGINWAFADAKGEYVQPLAADEFLEPHKLEMQVKYLDENKNISAVWGLPRNGDFGLRPEWEQYVLDAHNRSKAQWMETMLNLRNIPLGGCAALWRRDLFEKVGYFDESLTMFVDHEWYCRVIEHGEIKVLPYRWASFRPDPNAVSAPRPDNRERGEKELQYVRDKHSLLVDKGGDLVTVVIPVKDMAGYVRHAIDSVRAQTHKNWELIIVDDGSTDKTYEVIRKCMVEFEDKRISLVRFPTNRGDREACNEALRQAKGNFFMCLSADDLIHPTFMERCLKVFTGEACLEFVASQTDFITEDGKPHSEPHPLKNIEKASNKSQFDWKQRLYYGNVYFGAGMFRTQALKDVGGWKQKYGVISDYEMYLSMLQRWNIHVIEEDLTSTRIHPKNMSTNFDPVWLVNTYAEIRERFYPPRRKLIIATPFYEGRGYAPYIGSLVSTIKLLGQMGIEFEYWYPSGDAYVHRVKNTIFSKFLEDKSNTDLLMIDSDMEWEVQPLIKMLSCPEELIVGSYPQKNSWEKWTSKPHWEKDDKGEYRALQRETGDGGVLIQGQELAGGFVLVKRGILERYMEKYPELRYVDEGADPNSPNRIYTEFFSCGGHQQVGDDKRRFWGEDRQFSLRLNAMGEKWWIYSNIKFCHWGMKGWDGNFNDALMGWRNGPSNTGTSLQESPLQKAA